MGHYWDRRETVGPYRILGKLASGGMSTVHVGRARGATSGGWVAIKRLNQEHLEHPEAMDALLREARLASSVVHQNVVSTLDVLETAGQLFLVTEYIHGQSLSWLMKRAARANAPIPIAIAVAIVVDCLRGLHAAHEARTPEGVALHIVHRDVSPSNLMVGSDGVTRVLDFGFARLADQPATLGSSARIGGKIGYFSPEQVEGDRISRLADVYACSVVLWEALTGERRFPPNETPVVTLRRICDETVAKPSKHRAEVSAALDAIVMKGLARDPANRFASAQAMADALAAAGPLATTQEVAQWLESVAGSELSTRAARMAANDAEEASREGALDEGVTLPVATRRSLVAIDTKEPPRRRFTAGLITVAIAAAFAGFWIARPSGPPNVVTPTASVAPAAAPADLPPVAPSPVFGGDAGKAPTNENLRSTPSSPERPSRRTPPL